MYQYGLGSNAGIIRANRGRKLKNPKKCADAILDALSCLQVLLLARSASARRRYTRAETELAFVQLPSRFLRAVERIRYYHMGTDRGPVNPNPDCSTSEEELTPGDLPREARFMEYPSAQTSLTHTAHGGEIARDTGCTLFGDVQGCEGNHPEDVRAAAERTKGMSHVAKTGRMLWRHRIRDTIADIHIRCGSYQTCAMYR